MGPQKCIGPFHLGLHRVDGNTIGFGNFRVAFSLNHKRDENLLSLVGHLVQKVIELTVLLWLIQ